MVQDISPPESVDRLADRLRRARRRLFVGRIGDVELFQQAFLASEPPFAVLHVHAPGGVGKTTLLSEFARLAAETGARPITLDGRNIDASPEGFYHGLRQALGLVPPSNPLQALADGQRPILLIDTYERLASLDAWLREVFLPELPGKSLVVIAGRNPPSTAWRTDLAWSEVTRIISLRNFRPEESLALLNALGVPVERHDQALGLTHGHPLALALVADLLRRQDISLPIRLESDPEILHTLLERFVAEVPSPAHRLALEICAHARVTTQALLAQALPEQDSHSLFDWLRDLPFIEHSAQGIFPHDLAREVLDTDLRWRNPPGYVEVHKQVRQYTVDRIQQSDFSQQQIAFSDLIYLHRNSPVMKPFFEWQALGKTYAETASPDDRPAILEIIRRHEGEDSMNLAQFWIVRQPEGLTIFRNAERNLIGFMFTLSLKKTTAEERQIDPATLQVWEYIQRHGPARPQEENQLLRFWSGNDTYQVASAAHNMVAITCLRLWLSTPNLAWAFLFAADPDYWEPMFSYLYFQRAAQADFMSGGRRYAAFVHDWRADPQLGWLDRLAERELATDPNELARPQAPVEPLIALSQPEFDQAVRQALRDFTRPDLLATNPLIRSRLVTESGGNGVIVLQSRLNEAAACMNDHPKDQKLFRALQFTYFEPAPTQEAAAEMLGLPFTTYRYHLANGIKRVVERLWQNELYGSSEP